MQTEVQAERQEPKRVREAKNLLALASDLALRRTVWESRPPLLEYAQTSACNLKCPMCDQSNPARLVTSTPRERRLSVFEELFPSTTILKPFSLSEPLLNDFEQIVPHLVRHGVRLDVVTNACLMTPRQLELLLPHLHRITFSVDSHRKEIFEKVRPPAVFEEVDSNIRQAMPLLRRAGVLVRFNMVLVRDALPYLPDFVDYVVDQYGCEYLDVLELVPYMPGAAALDPFADPGEAQVGRALAAMLERARARRLNVGLIMREPFAGGFHFEVPPVPDTSAGVLEEAREKIRRDHPGFCDQAMMYLKVNPDGESYPCCKAPRELRLGNVFEVGLDGVWNSTVAQDMRRRMLSGDYPEPCRDCLFFTYSRTTAAAGEIPGRESSSGRVARLGRRFRGAGHRAARWSRGAARRLGRALGLPKILA